MRATCEAVLLSCFVQAARSADMPRWFLMSWDRKFEKREKQIKHNTYKTITTYIERHCFGSNLMKTLHGEKTYVLRCGSFVWSAKCYCQKITRKKCFRSEAASTLLPKYFPRHSSCCCCCCREPTRQRPCGALPLEQGGDRGGQHAATHDGMLHPIC